MLTATTEHNGKINNTYRVPISRLLAASKTANNFPLQFQDTTAYFEEKSNEVAISVALDWFSVMIHLVIAEPEPDIITYTFENDIILLYLEHGTPVFKHSYTVLRGGEPVANLHTHCRNEKTIGAGVAKLEIHNHLLYSTEWATIYLQILAALGASFRNVNRLDIAIDGVNWLHPFMNEFVKQRVKGKCIELKGKAHLSSKILRKKTMTYQNFTVGGSDSPKRITIYNKSSELERSNKQYIRTMWERAEMDTTNDVWRIELRMNSEGVKLIKNLDIGKLRSPKYLLSIFRTQTKNFFDFTYKTKDKKVTRHRPVDILCFNILKVRPLETTKRAKVDGRYKVKLGIHNAVKDLLNGTTADDDVQTMLRFIRVNTETYHLGRYITNKLPEWEKDYPGSVHNQNERVKRMEQIYESIGNYEN